MNRHKQTIEYILMDYKNGKIYKLVNDELNLTYYGSTCAPLHKRLYQHKHKSNPCSSKILFESGEVKIFLVELFPCNNRIELRQKERHYIENNDCVNKRIPNRTIKEYMKDNNLKYTTIKGKLILIKNKLILIKNNKQKQKQILENNKQFLEREQIKIVYFPTS